MSNIENIFSDRRKKEQELKLTYSKYIFNSHLIMFLIIVLGAVLINYSKWLAIASKVELYSVLIAATLAFSYYLVSSKIKTHIKEADAVFLLPLEKHYRKVGLKTVINSTVVHIITVIIFYFATKPITNLIGNIDRLSIFMLLIVIIWNNLLKYLQVIHYKEVVWSKLLLFVVIFMQLLVIFFDDIAIRIIYLISIIVLAAFTYYIMKNAGNKLNAKDQEKYVVNWNQAADYDKHRIESYLKFVNMFVDVPLSGVKVARRKYFDILLPKLTKDNFKKENSFKYYYYRVFLRQENTVYLALRLMLLAVLVIFSFKNTYVSGLAIISYSYLTIIQLVPLYKQMSNNIWHSILPVSEDIKIKSYKQLLTSVMIVTTLLLGGVSILLASFSTMNILVIIGSVVIANIISKIFIGKVK
ncbi:ABC transporter permease [Gemella haemolysans]|uniref:ABC transporter permease n=1 Tax=Gemella haemolysans TaxID=1379 RepID=A0AAW6B4C1_9BACL|nr:ABC transporter permease [Gemella haemolysans]MDB6186428.1 ABC transporter permease [Gemella haemolysans]